MSTTEIQTPTSDLAFFRNLVTVMAVVEIAGFVLHLAMGRSSFGAPLIVHLHAVVAMGWVAIVVAQAWLVSGGALRMHRTLGGLALVWMLALAVLGTMVTLAAVRAGRTPFFFLPQHFVVVNPATLLGAVGLFAAAVALRKNRDWHTRLQVGSFTMLMGPGLGRILPLPFLKPYAFEVAAGAAVIFPLIGLARDWRARGRPHPAWLWTIGVLAATLVGARVLALSPAGEAIYADAVKGAPAAQADGRAFPKPPF